MSDVPGRRYTSPVRAVIGSSDQGATAEHDALHRLEASRAQLRRSMAESVLPTKRRDSADGNVGRLQKFVAKVGLLPSATAALAVIHLLNGIRR